MTGTVENHLSNTQPMADLAKAWWELVQTQCPQDWCDSLPEIDLVKPQQWPEPQKLPVIDYLPELSNQAPAEFKALVEALIDAQSQLYFGQTYTAEDISEAFLQQYGWVKFLGPDAYWHSDQLSSGLLFLGPKITYPPHSHEAEELYLPISGDAEWYYKGQGWLLRPAGTLIHHASGIQHGTRTLGEPLIALYLWRGGNLTQKSNLA